MEGFSRRGWRLLSPRMAASLAADGGFSSEWPHFCRDTLYMWWWWPRLWKASLAAGGGFSRRGWRLFSPWMAPFTKTTKATVDQSEAAFHNSGPITGVLSQRHRWTNQRRPFTTVDQSDSRSVLPVAAGQRRLFPAADGGFSRCGWRFFAPRMAVFRAADGGFSRRGWRLFSPWMAPFATTTVGEDNGGRMFGVLCSTTVDTHNLFFAPRMAVFRAADGGFSRRGWRLFSPRMAAFLAADGGLSPDWLFTPRMAASRAVDTQLTM